jgi:predicted RNA binding protein YcfA (HicA-like mRNA interferase family)
MSRKKFARSQYQADQWTLSIPELGPGLLRKLIRQAGLTIEEFNEL